jgi:hypothetical protein
VGELRRGRERSSSSFFYVLTRGLRADEAGSLWILQKEQSKKYNTLVDAAPTLIKDLPWGADFEGSSLVLRSSLLTGPPLTTLNL